MPSTAEQWLRAIRDCDERERVSLVEDFYRWARPVIRRTVYAVRGSEAEDHIEGTDDIELVVTEALLTLVRDVVVRAADPAHGRALTSVLSHRARREFRRLVHRKALGASSAPVTEAVTEMVEDLHLERPHMVTVEHRVSGLRRNVGPFGDVVTALAYAERVEIALRSEDSQWRATVHVLLDAEETAATLVRGRA